MEKQPVPTFGRVVQLLKDLGLETKPAKSGVLALAHASSGAEFLFRERGPDNHARENELVNLRVQLTDRGLLTEKELDNLLAPTTQPTPTAPQ
jgi:hypothetical protein